MILTVVTNEVECMPRPPTNDPDRLGQSEAGLGGEQVRGAHLDKMP